MAPKKKNNKVVKLPKRKTETPEEKQQNLSLDSIAKIKFDLKSSIPEISCFSENERYTKSSGIKGKEVARDEFIAALQKLKPFFCSICEIEHKLDDTSIHGITFDKTGIVISAQLKLTKYDFKQPIPINSPHLFYENKNGGFEIPAEVESLLIEIKKQALGYLLGDYKFIQTNMFA